MYEYIFAFSIIPARRYNIIGLEHRSDDKFLKSIKAIRDDILGHYLHTFIYHSKEDELSEIKKKVEAAVREEVERVAIIGNQNSYFCTLCFAVAAKHYRWDIVRIKTVNETPTLELIQDLNQYKFMHVPVKIINVKVLNGLKDIVFKYIDKRVKPWGGTLYDSSGSQMGEITDNDGIAEKRSDS